MIKRILLIAVAVIGLAAAFTVVDADPASAFYSGQPYGDERHWARSTGNQTVVYIRIDKGVSEYGQLFKNVAADVSQGSSTLQVYAQNSCPSASNCIHVLPWSNPDELESCGSTIGHGSLTTYNGHVHFSSNILGIDFHNILGGGCGLASAQYLACNGIMRNLGVQWGGGASPCEGGVPSTIGLHPSTGDLNVATILHAHRHSGTIYPVGQ